MVFRLYEYNAWDSESQATMTCSISHKLFGKQNIDGIEFKTYSDVADYVS